MDQQSGVGSLELKKDRSHAQGVGASATQSGPDHTSAQSDGQQEHGESGAQPSGVLINSGVATTNGEHADSIMALAGSEAPPQLDQSWRSGEQNKHLGRMVDRLAQQAYIDLNKCLTEMTAQDGAADNAIKSNGLSPPGSLDTSEISLRKKKLLMEFAHDQRDRFTKTLVLSDWSKNAEEMASLIDIRMWQETQRSAYTEAANAIAATKFKTIDFKVPAPNIQGAMELLATGKASWVPDMGYIPPKRLTAKQLLKTIKNMNVTLSTRLNLHEELPPHMQDFTIANGRATFTVPGEFEVDFSVADEENTSPFYFIDFRFLFSPSSDVLNDQIRAHLETQTNVGLATKGLKGAYDFLHNFVLTHKINILRSQSAELIRGKWFDCIKVEHMRRSLIVQYWATTPGPKSWFEVGISSGKSRKTGSAASTKATSRISVRWFRKGIEVKDEVLDFDWEMLSLEKCLITVIGKHCFGKLGVAREGLRSLAATSAVLEAEIPESEDVAPEDCALKLHLPSMRKPLNIRVEPVTGQFSISPPSSATLNCERALNGDPQVDVARSLAALICTVVQERIQKQAELLDWRDMRNLASPPKFGQDMWRWTVFAIPGWGQQWALAVSFSLSGEKWWVVQLKVSKAVEPSKTVPREVGAVRQLPIVKTLGDGAADPSRGTLLRIDRLAVAELSYALLSQQLRGMKIPHRFEKTVLSHGNDVGDTPQSTGAVYLQFAALMRPARDKTWKPWATDSIRLSHHGIEDTDDVTDVNGKQTLVRHDLRMTLEAGKIKHLQKHLSLSRHKDVAVNGSGGLALRLRTPFGESIMEHIRMRLRSIERLDQYVTTLQKMRYKLTAVSLEKLSFAYHVGPPALHAHLTFSGDDGLSTRLKLEPAESNPTQRIRVMLEQGLKKQGTDTFQLFTQLLALTLPTLRVMERIESAHMTKQTATVRARSSTWYAITYKPPLSACAFSIRLRSKLQGNKTVMRWHVAAEKPDANTPEQLAKRLKVFWQDKGEGWEGIGSGAMADAAAIGLVLEKLDELIRASDLPSSVAEMLPEGDATAVQNTALQLPQPPKEPQKKPTAPAKPAKAAASAKKNGGPEPDYIMLD